MKTTMTKQTPEPGWLHADDKTTITPAADAVRPLAPVLEDETPTPTPWRITACRDDKDGSFYIRGIDESGADMPLAVTRHGPERANAALIVLAVNDRPELIEENERLRTALARVLIERDTLRAALKQVEFWNANDMASIDDITPSLEMLEARSEAIRAALATQPA